MIRYICNCCLKDTTKKYADVHIVINEGGREIARSYHICPKCTTEMMRLIRKDDKVNGI